MAKTIIEKIEDDFHFTKYRVWLPSGQTITLSQEEIKKFALELNNSIAKVVLRKDAA